MKIGHFSVRVWSKGGIASYIHRISSAQVAAGHSVLFLDSVPCEPPKDSPAELIHTPTAADLFRVARTHKLDIIHAHSLIRDTGDSPVPIVRTVHVHESYCPSNTKYLSRPGKPCDRGVSVVGCTWGHIVNRCGSARPKAILSNFNATWAEQTAIAHNHAIAISEYTRQQMLRERIDPSRLTLLYSPGPSPKTLSAPPAEGMPRFLFLGRVSPVKGLSWLMRSLAKTRQQVMLDVAGEGQLDSAAMAEAKDLRLTDRVTFHGWKDATGVQELLTKCRALVFPSIWQEPFGLVSLDAMAVGRAVIGSKVGAIPEVVQDNVNGLIVPGGDETALASAMDTLAADWALAKRLGEEGWRQLPLRFSLEGHMRSLMDIYGRCIADYAAKQKS